MASSVHRITFIVVWLGWDTVVGFSMRRDGMLSISGKAN